MIKSQIAKGALISMLALSSVAPVATTSIISASAAAHTTNQASSVLAVHKQTNALIGKSTKFADSNSAVKRYAKSGLSIDELQAAVVGHPDTAYKVYYKIARATPSERKWLVKQFAALQTYIYTEVKRNGSVVVKVKATTYSYYNKQLTKHSKNPYIKGDFIVIRPSLDRSHGKFIGSSQAGWIDFAKVTVDKHFTMASTIKQLNTSKGVMK